jgi:hypothetical protein
MSAARTTDVGSAKLAPIQAVARGTVSPGAFRSLPTSQAGETLEGSLTCAVPAEDITEVGAE